MVTGGTPGGGCAGACSVVGTPGGAAGKPGGGSTPGGAAAVVAVLSLFWPGLRYVWRMSRSVWMAVSCSAVVVDGDRANVLLMACSAWMILSSVDTHGLGR